jgi:hypothetical protein
MKIKVDDLQHPAIHALLNEHLQNMHEITPPESVHALNLEKLRAPAITFWTAWENDLLLGCEAPNLLTEIVPLDLLVRVCKVFGCPFRHAEARRNEFSCIGRAQGRRDCIFL